MRQRVPWEKKYVTYDKCSRSREACERVRRARKTCKKVEIALKVSKEGVVIIDEEDRTEENRGQKAHAQTFRFQDHNVGSGAREILDKNAQENNLRGANSQNPAAAILNNTSATKRNQKQVQQLLHHPARVHLHPHSA